LRTASDRQAVSSSSGEITAGFCLAPWGARIVRQIAHHEEKSPGMEPDMPRLVPIQLRAALWSVYD